MREAPLDVVMLHYGSVVKSDWAAIKVPPGGPGELGVPRECVVAEGAGTSEG